MIKPIQDTSDDNRNNLAYPRYIGRWDKLLHLHTIMIGRGRQGIGWGGRGARGQRGRGRCNSYPSHINNINNNNKGLWIALGHHEFNCGQKGAAYKTRITWEKIINHVRTIYGHNISNKSQNNKWTNIPQPEHTQQVKDKHLNRFEQLRDQHSRIMQDIEVKFKLLEEIVQRQEYP